MNTRPSIEERQRRDRQQDGITAGLAVIILLGAVAIFFFVTARPDKVRSQPDLMDPLDCERVVELEKLTGLVKDHPSPTRIDVDEARWSGMTADQKRIVLDHVACAAFDGRMLARLEPAQHVSAHSASSGRLLTRAGAARIPPQ